MTNKNKKSDKNGGTPEPLVPAEAFENLDLSIAPELLLEALAAEHKNYLVEYHAIEVSLPAARHSNNHKLAEELSTRQVFLRTVLALAQHKHPGIKELTDEISRYQAQAVKTGRAEAMESQRT